MKLTDSDRLRMVAAIADAERGSGGEVRVHLEERCKGDALARARDLFEQLGMHRTKGGTGVLLYVAMRDRKTAVFAGPGIHLAAGESFWTAVSQQVSSGFAAGDGVAGVLGALVGGVLREHRASRDVHGDELPNAVTTS